MSSAKIYPRKRRAMPSEAEKQSGSTDSPSTSWPDWSGRTVCCVATGPSLTRQQCKWIRDRHKAGRVKVIAVNEAGLKRYKPLAVPFADILYAADRAWWQHYRPEFYNLRVSGERVVDVNTIPLEMVESKAPMPRQPGAVISGGHSGFQALGLALTLGAARVLLFGYDCGGPKRNAHDNRPEQFKRRVDMVRWIQVYDRVPKEWPDVRVYNCAPGSRIRAFHKLDCEELPI